MRISDWSSYVCSSDLGAISTIRACRAMPGLPGAANSLPSFGDCASFHASACSRAPEPISRTFMDDFPNDDGGLLATEAPGDNAPALSDSELSMALKRAVENAFGDRKSTRLNSSH